MTFTILDYEVADFFKSSVVFSFRGLCKDERNDALDIEHYIE